MMPARAPSPQGTEDFSQLLTFDFSACVEKEVIVVGVGVYFLSLLAEFSLGKTPQAAG